MAKINLQQNQKGITLIEILMYMSIFLLISVVTMSSVFYLQKIIQNNNQNYYIKNQIYTNLNILQLYMYKNHVTLRGQDLIIFSKNGELMLTQKIENNSLKNIYQNKQFFIDEKISFTKYDIYQLEKNRLLKFDISWLDNRGKQQNLIDYLVVINSNL